MPRSSNKAAPYKSIILLVIILVLWEAAVLLLEVPEYFIPAPSRIVREGYHGWSYLLINTPATIYEILAGFGLALAVGIIIAVPVALTRFGKDALMPIVVGTQAVPKTALAPIFVIWFGFGLAPKIAMAAAIAFFPIVVNLAQGLQDVEEELVQYARTLGASRLQVFVKLRLPSALPYLFAGMKVAISLAVVGAIVGEFIGASEGLGYITLRAINNFDTPIMFAALTLVSLIGMLFYGVIGIIERAAMRW